ncbi:MAG: acyltransferase [Chloroflexi bacterium]|nr:MAG: acyltransferase [Chloroflexota bacterium]
MENMATLMAAEGSGRRTADRIAPHGNNFTLLRVLAACVVIWDHAYRLVGLTPPLSDRIAFTDTGTIAVYTFFCISGYLLLGSWAATPKLGQFILKRALRIMPGLMVAVAGAALLFGTLATDLPVGQYLTSPQTRQYVFENWTMFNPQYVLPGVFAHQPYNVVNGSIWTLCYEVTLYTLVPFLGVLLLRRWRLFGTMVVIGVAVLPWDHLPPAVPFLSGLNIAILATFGRYFLMGSLLYAWRDRVPLRWPVVLAVAAAFGIGFGHWWGAWISYAALPYLVIYLARLDIAALRGRFRRRDLSYGLYVWAFPVEQSIVSVAGGAGDARQGGALPPRPAAAGHRARAPAVPRRPPHPGRRRAQRRLRRDRERGPGRRARPARAAGRRREPAGGGAQRASGHPRRAADRVAARAAEADPDLPPRPQRAAGQARHPRAPRLRASRRVHGDLHRRGRPPDLGQRRRRQGGRGAQGEVQPEPAGPPARRLDGHRHPGELRRRGGPRVGRLRGRHPAGHPPAHRPR